MNLSTKEDRDRDETNGAGVARHTVSANDARIAARQDEADDVDFPAALRRALES